MGTIKFNIMKSIDAVLLDGLHSVALTFPTLFPPGGTRVNVNVGFPLQELMMPNVEPDQNLQIIRSFGACNIRSASYRNGEYRIEVQRKDGGFDEATLTWPDGQGATDLLALLDRARKALKYRDGNWDSVLEDQLRDYYNRREQIVQRLEQVDARLIEETHNYRIELDRNAEAFKQEELRRTGEYANQLRADYEAKEAALQKREEELERRIKEVQDRDSKHERRAIRLALKEKIEKLGKEFNLTHDTIKKREPTRNLYYVLMVVALAAMIYSGLEVFLAAKASAAISWFMVLKFPLSALVFIGSVVFFIRWNDSWFLRHARTEFYLKQFDLDIERASWLVEMAMEWKAEKGSEIPGMLIDRLSRNLFSQAEDLQEVKHPSEDILGAVFGASSRFAIKGNGAEAEWDRKGIQKAKKAIKGEGEA